MFSGRPTWQRVLILLGIVLGAVVALRLFGILIGAKPRDPSASAAAPTATTPTTAQPTPTSPASMLLSPEEARSAAAKAGLPLDELDQSAMEAKCKTLGREAMAEIRVTSDGKPYRAWRCKAPPRDPGVFITKRGYLAAATKEKLERAVGLVSDPPALEALLRSDREVFQLGEGIEVVAVDSGGVLSSVVKVRKKGALAEFWTVREALE